jgi:putative transposase
VIRTFRYPLRPNKAQEAVLDVYLWRCQQLYNAALEQRRDAYQKQGKTLSWVDQFKDLTELRQGDADFGAVPAKILRSALKRLDLAYQAFFRRLKTGEKPGFPRFRGRDRFKSFSLMFAPSINGSKILVPKLGHVRFHEYRPIKGKPLDASIRKDSTGKWWVGIQCDLGEPPAKLKPVSHVGVDVGLTSFATLSTGEHIDNPRYFRALESLLAKRQRSLSLKKRGSKSRGHAKKLVARAHEHIKNQRLDFVRKLAVSLFSRFDLVSYEDLNIRGMVHGNLSKSIYDAAWGLLGHALACKAEEAGKWAVTVDPRGTSQRCSRCGALPLLRKTLADRVHFCSCGPPMDRDENAACNIDALGLSAVEGGREAA